MYYYGRAQTTRTGRRVSEFIIAKKNRQTGWESPISRSRVVWVELLAHQLDARRGRGGVGLEPLLDGAALVSFAIRIRLALIIDTSR